MQGCTCGQTVHSATCPLYQAIGIRTVPPTTPPAANPSLVGWICPLCQRGVAPLVQRCPCREPIV